MKHTVHYTAHPCNNVTTPKFIYSYFTALHDMAVNGIHSMLYDYSPLCDFAVCSLQCQQMHECTTSYQSSALSIWNKPVSRSFVM